MDKPVFILFSNTALQLREVVNIALLVSALVLCCLIGYYIAVHWSKHKYHSFDWTQRLSIGLFFIFAGEFVRSLTIWEILHFEGSSGNYLSDILPLMLSLLFIVVGSLCAIRVFSPRRCPHTFWIGAFVVMILASILALMT